MRHEHKPVPESTPERVVYAALQDIQRLCARGAELDQIWERAEQAIAQAKSRH